MGGHYVPNLTSSAAITKEAFRRNVEVLEQKLTMMKNTSAEFFKDRPLCDRLIHFDREFFAFMVKISDTSYEDFISKGTDYSNALVDYCSERLKAFRQHGLANPKNPPATKDMELATVAPAFPPDKKIFRASKEAKKTKRPIEDDRKSKKARHHRDSAESFIVSDDDNDDNYEPESESESEPDSESDDEKQNATSSRRATSAASSSMASASSASSSMASASSASSSMASASAASSPIAQVPSTPSPTKIPSVPMTPTPIVPSEEKDTKKQRGKNNKKDAETPATTANPTNDGHSRAV